MKSTLFEQAPGIAPPRSIQSIRFDDKTNRLDIYLEFRRGSTFVDENSEDPDAYTAYDTVPKTWRHLNFFQHECYLHARVPRIRRKDGRVRMIPPPRSGVVSGFSLLFEALLIQPAERHDCEERRQADRCIGS